MDKYINEIINNGLVTKRFKYASLFSGIGGFETALNALGGECVFASEIDKFARKAYEALYGQKPSGDITEIHAEDIPNHDVLVGGFPCQSFSVAGKRGGFEDTRGTLIYDVVRIASVKQPSVLLLENVKGLISHDKGRTLDTIMRIINDAGYRLDFEVLNSKYFGVPQNRERVFIVCIREDLVDNDDWIIRGTNVVAKGKKRISQYDGVKTFNFDYPTNTTISDSLADFLEKEVNERFFLSEEKIAKLVTQLKERESSTIKLGNPNKIAGMYGKSQAGSVYHTAGVSPTLDTMQGGGREPMIAIPILSPDRVNKSQNGRRFKKDGEPMFTLTAQDRHGIITNDTQSFDSIYGNTEVSSASRSSKSRYGVRIRKLTPKECWRLQGFSDAQHDAVENAGVSNSQRYKQAGNAVTVNVVYAITKRLLKYLD